MVFSRAAEYAIRAMVFLATQPSGKVSGAREISEAEQIPGPFLWKVLQNLTRRKLIRSFKGVRGGYELARPAASISVDDIVIATDGGGTLEGCVLGLSECSEENPCPLHNSWKDVRLRLTEIMEETTLADLAEVARKRSLAKGRDGDSSQSAL